MPIFQKKKFTFRLRGKTLVLIDWANVYGWQESLNWEISPKKLYAYLNRYKQIRRIRFYFGRDKHKKSVNFLQQVKNSGFTVVTKDVKYVPVTLDKSYFRKIIKRFKQNFVQLNLTKYQQGKLLEVVGQTIFRRKCDFDVEIVMDVHKFIDKFDSLILFSGDGDYAPLLKFCLDKGKQVIVVFAPGHLGKEIREKADFPLLS
jgi:uncharacterized LabA/DUF88 family protein